MLLLLLKVIIPRLHDDYSHLVQHINAKKHSHDEPHTLTFHNTYFFLDLAPDAHQPAHMRTASFRLSAPPSAIGVRIVSRTSLPFNRQPLSCDVCLEAKRGDTQKCSVLCCQYTK